MKSKYKIDFVKPPIDPSDEFWGISEIQHIKIVEATLKRAYAIDSYMQARIQPKPKFLPSFIWKFLLKKLLVLKHFQIN